jgi:hypothetical protein
MPVSVAKSSIWTIDVAVLGKRVAESPMPRTKTTGSPQLLLVYAQDVAEYAGTGAKGGAAAACVPDAMQETIVAAVVATPAPRTQDVVQDATVAVEATTAAAPAVPRPIPPPTIMLPRMSSLLGHALPPLPTPRLSALVVLHPPPPFVVSLICRRGCPRCRPHPRTSRRFFC